MFYGKKRKNKTERKENRQQELEKAQQFVEDTDMKGRVLECSRDLGYSLIDTICSAIKKNESFARQSRVSDMFVREYRDFLIINEENFFEFLNACDKLPLFNASFSIKAATGMKASGLVRQKFFHENTEDRRVYEHVRGRYNRAFDVGAEEVRRIVEKGLLEEKCAMALLENPSFIKNVDRYNKRMKAKYALNAEILESIPDDITELYPKARMIDRQFFLHVGPTNSGKTYEAIQDLMRAENGAYLAPLRLLAYEQFENMNSANVPCTLLTGEEHIYVEGAKHFSSTIEKADLAHEYECVVIDEAQMIADPDRGGAWTQAILGMVAKRIHICMSPNAMDRVCEMISSCGDSYEIIHHHRMTKLVMEKDRLSFPDCARRGDAFIVFSRIDVHWAAAELQAAGVKCSVIYGALPYETRHREAEKFAAGETDVVVATDAIGMGMNLPIRRVVFLYTSKYDGHDKRYLHSSEVKQIGGRAGRYGIYDQGYVNSIFDWKMIKSMLMAPDESIKEAVLGFPQLLLKLNAPVSHIMERWIQIPFARGYKKPDLEVEIKLAAMIEDKTEDKELVYKLVTIPFAEGDKELMQIWYELALCVMTGRTCNIPEFYPDHGESDDLGRLEQDYHIYDLLYNYSEKFENGVFSGRIMEEKKRISDSITRVLSQKRFKSKGCKICGKPLAWNYRYMTCPRCFEQEKYSTPYKRRRR